MTYDDVFSISPNPMMMVTTPAIRAVLFKVRYCVNAKQGLALIIGDFGLGKSTVLRALHGEFSGRPDITTTLLPTAKFPTALSFLKKICDDLGVSRKKSSLDQQAEFERFLIDQAKAGKTVVICIDEAQLMDAEQLELIRTLLNHETHTHKLIQFVLAGQLSLVPRLKGPKLKALKSRIIAPCSVNPLSLDEASQMIRLRCESWGVSNPFPAPVLERMYQLTDGVPRLLLRLAALSAALAETTSQPITAALVESVAADMELPDEEEDARAESATTV
jgi:type II secretory pathway predicted ATPase ExeA